MTRGPKPQPGDDVDAEGALSAEQVLRAWRRVLDRAAELRMDNDSQLAWPVVPGSALAGDDARADPWRTSHAAAAALNASSDHLHALCGLVAEAKLLHTHADYTLARGCLESAGVALWIVAPSQRRERVVRGLRWYATDAREGDRAVSELGLPMPRPLTERLADFHAAASRVGGGALDSINATAVMREAGTGDVGRMPALFAWRLCSGFAHARPWAPLSLLEREVFETPDPNVRHLRMTNTLSRLLFAAWAGLELLERAIEVYRQRAASHY